MKAANPLSCSVMDPTSDADVVTFESCSAGGMDLDAFGDDAHTEWEHGLISSIEPCTRLMRGLLETLQ